MKFDPFTRRFFLKALGGGALSLPFLPSAFERVARGQTAPTKKRLIVIKSYSTQNIVDFYPSGYVTTASGTQARAPNGGYAARNYGGEGGANGKNDGTCTLTQTLGESSGRHPDNNQEYFGRFAPLADFAGTGISRILNADFNPYLSRMLLLRGLDFLPGTNHNEGGILGNYATSLAPEPGVANDPTIDQVLAASSKFYDVAPLGPRLLHISSGEANTFSVDLSGQQAVAHTNPRNAFNDVFQFVTPGSSGDPNRRLVDRVLEDYQRLKTHPRLSQNDKVRVDQHLSFLAELQSRLMAPTESCQVPNAPASLSLSGASVTDIGRFYDDAIDVAVAALMCDATRIVTLNLYRAVGQRAGGPAGYMHSCAACDGRPANPTDWHQAAHEWENVAEREKVVAINEWIAKEIFLKLIQKLDVEESDGQSYLDNTIIMWGNELGMNHLNWSIPVVTCGNVGGFLGTGRYIDYIAWNRNVRFSQHNGMVIEGVPYNRLLVSLLQAYGLSPSDYETGGRAGYGEHRPLGKTQNLHAIGYDFSKLGNILPSIRA